MCGFLPAAGRLQVSTPERRLTVALAACSAGDDTAVDTAAIDRWADELPDIVATVSPTADLTPLADEVRE